MGYKLKLDAFEGPLDLLLFLIKKNEIDVCDIPIAEITDQYMEYIEMMKLLDLDIVGDFLVMAATLMQIKSRMLLPPDPDHVDGDQEDPRDELVRRLQEYQQFKEVAEALKEKETERARLYARMMDENALNELKEDAKEVYFEANLFDLITALSRALNSIPEKGKYEVVREEYTVEQKIHDILHSLVDNPRFSLTQAFRRLTNRMEIIVTFIAVLELTRLKEVSIVQNRLFDEIEVVRNDTNINEGVESSESSAEPSESSIEPPAV